MRDVHWCRRSFLESVTQDLRELRHVESLYIEDRLQDTVEFDAADVVRIMKAFPLDVPAVVGPCCQLSLSPRLMRVLMHILLDSLFPQT